MPSPSPEGETPRSHTPPRSRNSHDCVTPISDGGTLAAGCAFSRGPIPAGHILRVHRRSASTRPWRPPSSAASPGHPSAIRASDSMPPTTSRLAIAPAPPNHRRRYRFHGGAWSLSGSVDTGAPVQRRCRRYARRWPVRRSRRHPLKALDLVGRLPRHDVVTLGVRRRISAGGCQTMNRLATDVEPPVGQELSMNSGAGIPNASGMASVLHRNSKPSDPSSVARFPSIVFARSSGSRSGRLISGSGRCPPSVGAQDTLASTSCLQDAISLSLMNSASSPGFGE